MHPQHIHDRLDEYEQHLTTEKKRIEAVRTLLPPSQNQKGGPRR